MEQSAEKNEKTTAPSVAIDGTRIKGVRETKKLTQLYVANVVGVTTDTISRWENNRYPSIRRDNAEKLAGALEVSLEDILRQDEIPPVPEPDNSVPSGWRLRRLLLSGLAFLTVLSLTVFFIVRYRIPTPTAVRWAPRFAAPGEVIPVQIKITRQGGEHTGFILKEEMPRGWRLITSVPASSLADASGSEVKWLIPGGTASVTVSYTVQVPATPLPKSEVKLVGEIVVHAGGMNRTEAVVGSNSVRIGPYHWADANGDGRIDDDEIMPAYYICEEMKGLGLDWKTIEAIWSGKGYLWDAVHGFTVVKFDRQRPVPSV